MGIWSSRQNAGVVEIDNISNHAYKYPSRSGNYFGSHFIMGGERFDTPQPEAYLFGENTDLNFLGNRPTPFPYPPPQSNEPTKTLKCLVNIRKESLRFVRAPPDCDKVTMNSHNNGKIQCEEIQSKSASYNIEFTFDSDVRCSITIYYFCTEEMTPNGIQYISRDPGLNSETFHYKRGANQQFCQPMHVFDPSKFTCDELAYNVDKEIIPIAIHCVVEEGFEEIKQSHTTIAVIEKHLDGSYVIKALKQKIFIDGLCYLLQEIYGIENKNLDKNICDDEIEDNGSECVICMCDIRDTLILPCRHLCLCNSCADSLRYQANNCPICRAPFRALLQIRALQKYMSNNQLQLPTAISPSLDDNCENIPNGFELVSLIEALNGPRSIQMKHSNNILAELIETNEDVSMQAAEVLNRSNIERNNRKNSPKDKDYHKSSRERLANNDLCQNTDFRMSVMTQQEEDNKLQRSPLLVNSSTKSSPGSPLPIKQTILQLNNNGSYKIRSGNTARKSIKQMNEQQNEKKINDIDDKKLVNSGNLSPLLNRNLNKTKSESVRSIASKESMLENDIIDVLINKKDNCKSNSKLSEIDKLDDRAEISLSPIGGTNLISPFSSSSNSLKNNKQTDSFNSKSQENDSIKLTSSKEHISDEKKVAIEGSTDISLNSSFGNLSEQNSSGDSFASSNNGSTKKLLKNQIQANENYNSLNEI